MKRFVSALVVVLCFGVINEIYGRQGLPPMSLSEIRKDIQQLESPEQKLRTYIEMSSRYFRNSPDSLIIVAKEINQLEGISNEQKEAFSSFVNANAYRLMNQDSTIHYADIASSKLKDLGEHEQYLIIENLRASHYSRKNEYLEAESLFLEAISYQKELEDDEVEYPIHYFYGNLGQLYVNVEAHDLAIQMFEKFLEFEDNPAARCNILAKLSGSFLKMKSYDKAISTLDPCIEFDNLPPPIKSMVRSNLSTIYKEKGELDIATKLLEQASQVSQQYRVPNLSNSQMHRLGDLYLEQNMIIKADSIGKLVDQSSLKFSRPNEDINKFRFLSKLAMAKGEYRQAISIADNALQIAERADLKRLLVDIYEIKASAYESLGEIDKALENERLQRAHETMLSDLRNEMNQNLLSVRYQLQNKEAQLMDANLQLENIRSRNLLIIIGLMLISGYIFYRYRVFYLLKEEKTRNQIARDLHDDLSGTLSSISFFSEAAKRVQKKPEESKRFLEIIDKSAVEAKEKINDIIWAIDPTKDDWTLFMNKCKRFASDLLDSNDIDYNLHISEDIDFPLTLEVRQNLWLIFKECITNLGKHSKAKQATIILKNENDWLLLKISDDGVGFKPDQISNGNGLKNMRFRARSIGGNTHLETAPGIGTTWTFKFQK